MPKKITASTVSISVGVDSCRTYEDSGKWVSESVYRLFSDRILNRLRSSDSNILPGWERMVPITQDDFMDESAPFKYRTLYIKLDRQLRITPYDRERVYNPPFVEYPIPLDDNTMTKEDDTRIFDRHLELKKWMNESFEIVAILKPIEFAVNHVDPDDLKVIIWFASKARRLIIDNGSFGVTSLAYDDIMNIPNMVNPRQIYLNNIKYTNLVDSTLLSLKNLDILSISIYSSSKSSIEIACMLALNGVSHLRIDNQDARNPDNLDDLIMLDTTLNHECSALKNNRTRLVSFDFHESTYQDEFKYTDSEAFIIKKIMFWLLDHSPLLIHLGLSIIGMTHDDIVERAKQIRSLYLDVNGCYFDEHNELMDSCYLYERIKNKELKPMSRMYNNDRGDINLPPRLFTLDTFRNLEHIYLCGRIPRFSHDLPELPGLYYPSDLDLFDMEYENDPQDRLSLFQSVLSMPKPIKGIYSCLADSLDGNTRLKSLRLSCSSTVSRSKGCLDIDNQSFETLLDRLKSIKVKQEYIKQHIAYIHNPDSNSLLYDIDIYIRSVIIKFIQSDQTLISPFFAPHVLPSNKQDDVKRTFRWFKACYHKDGGHFLDLDMENVATTSLLSHP